jgi:hypothetical protein
VQRHLCWGLFTDGSTDPGFEARVEWAVDQSKGMLGAAAWPTRFGLTAILLWLQWLGPLVMGLGFKRLTSLRHAETVQLFEALEGSRAGYLLIASWKVVLAAHYFEHPDAFAQLGAGHATRGAA